MKWKQKSTKWKKTDIVSVLNSSKKLHSTVYTTDLCWIVDHKKNIRKHTTYTYATAKNDYFSLIHCLCERILNFECLMLHELYYYLLSWCTVVSTFTQFNELFCRHDQYGRTKILLQHGGKISKDCFKANNFTKKGI